MLVQELFETSVSIELFEASKFKQLQKNKVVLTPEERKIVFSKKAVWNHGPNGEETAAVWKSVNPKTKKTTYVTHTHRAF